MVALTLRPVCLTFGVEMATTSPTQQTLRECRRRGWSACIVERWIAPARQRVDAFGFGDVLAVDPETPDTYLIQACITGHVLDRAAKILGKPEGDDERALRRADRIVADATAWLAAGNRIVVWGWAKRGARGKRKLWTLREMEIGLSRVGQLQAEEQAA